MHGQSTWVHVQTPLAVRHTESDALQVWFAHLKKAKASRQVTENLSTRCVYQTESIARDQHKLKSKHREHPPELSYLWPQNNELEWLTSLSLQSLRGLLYATQRPPRCKDRNSVSAWALTKTASLPNALAQSLLTSAEVWFLASDQPRFLPSLFLLCPHTQANRVHI